jgi:hypothetical protein
VKVVAVLRVVNPVNVVKAIAHHVHPSANVAKAAVLRVGNSVNAVKVVAVLRVVNPVNVVKAIAHHVQPSANVAKAAVLVEAKVTTSVKIAVLHMQPSVNAVKVAVFAEATVLTVMKTRAIFVPLKNQLIRKNVTSLMVVAPSQLTKQGRLLPHLTINGGRRHLQESA